MHQQLLEDFMAQAIVEGRKARSICSPNPPVGCVLVSDNTVVAVGHTNKPGQPHAEAMALANLEEGHSDITAFVTLEPCSFHGRTPSCAKALVAHHIAGVYVGILDPDPRNSGKGLQILNDAGIAVTVGILAEQITYELAPYLYSDT